MADDPEPSDALEERARQAGSEGAATVVRGMIGTVAEVLGTIDERLDRLEVVVADIARETARTADVERRLTGLEDTLQRALQEGDAGATSVVEAVATRVDAAVRRLSDNIGQPDTGPRLADVEGLRRRLDEVAEGIAAAVQAMGGRLEALASTPPRPAIEPAILERLVRIESGMSDLVGRPLPAEAQPAAPAAASLVDEDVALRLLAIEGLLRRSAEQRPVDAAEFAVLLDDRLEVVEAMRKELAGEHDRMVRIEAAVPKPRDIAAALDERLGVLEGSLSRLLVRIGDVDTRLVSVVRSLAEGASGTGAAPDASIGEVAKVIESVRVQLLQHAAATASALGLRGLDDEVADRPPP